MSDAENVEDIRLMADDRPACLTYIRIAWKEDDTRYILFLRRSHTLPEQNVPIFLNDLKYGPVVIGRLKKSVQRGDGHLFPAAEVVSMFEKVLARK